MIRKQLAKSCQ